MFEIIKKSYKLIKNEAKIGATKENYLDRPRLFWLLTDFITSLFFLIIFLVVEFILITISFIFYV